MNKHHAQKPRKAASIIDSVITDIENAKLFKLVNSSFKAWYRNWPWVLLSVLVDFIFLISVSTIITLIQFSLFDHLEALMTMAGEATGGLMNIYNQTAAVPQSLAGMASTADFQYHLTIIFKYLGLMILASFVLWVIFQGISWYIAQRMATEKKERQSFLVYMKNFALQSLPFHLITVLWIFLSVRILFSIKMSIAPVMGEDLLNFIFVLLVVITWYFGSLCYTLRDKFAYRNFKQSFMYGIKRFPKVIQSFLFLAVLFILIDQLLRFNFVRSDPFLMIILGSVLFMPAIVFARILLFKTTEEYWNKK